MTPLTEQELNQAAFESITPQAQEAVYRNAFDLVVPKVQDTKAAIGSIQAVDHTRHGDGGGHASFTKRRFFVAPTLTDFVCDVDKTARKSLTRDEYAHFKHVYFVEGLAIANMKDPMDRTEDGRDKFLVEFLDTHYEPQDQMTFIGEDRRIRLKLGAAFIRQGIYPYKEYAEARDISDALRGHARVDRPAPYEKPDISVFPDCEHAFSTRDKPTTSCPQCWTAYSAITYTRRKKED